MSHAEPREMPIPDAFPVPFGLTGRRVVVTGAGRGLGRVIATAFARSGATLGLVARSIDQLKSLADALPGEHLVFGGDVRDGDFNTHVAESMRDQLGGIDTWIGNAGISPVVEAVEKVDPADWRAIVETNLTGAFLGVRAAARVMTEGSSIILTSSVIGQRSRRGLSAYAASKAGMEALVRTLALELGSRDITVNAVAPGWFDSPLAAPFRDRAPLGEQILAHTALGRWGQSGDQPGLFLFLASDAARFITGAVIPLDGGYLLP